MQHSKNKCLVVYTHTNMCKDTSNIPTAVLGCEEGNER